MSLTLRLDKVIAHILSCRFRNILSPPPMVDSISEHVQFPFINLQLESPAQYMLLLVFQRAGTLSFQRNTLKRQLAVPFSNTREQLM